MANLPILITKEQVVGRLVAGFLARVADVNDLTRGSIIFRFFSAIGQVNFKSAADIIGMIDALSVDRADGEALQRLAADANVPISPGTFANGFCDITDISFTKVASTIYAGQPAPVAGSTKIFLVDGSSFAATGKIYLGRGTPNVEGPLTFISVQPEAGGAYWSITLDPTSPTTKFHNIGENIVQAQGGNRLILSGTVVSTPTGSGITNVTFNTTSDATILDGEVLVQNVPVTSSQLGIKGNVPRGAIREAVGLPFQASVFNNNPIINGLPPDDEDTIRANIKKAEKAKSKGTEDAIQAASIGVQSSDDQKTVTSSSVIRFSDGSAALVFDDGTGYEPIFHGIGIEQVVDAATGGEEEIQLRSFPITSARVKTINVGPYNIPDEYALDVEIHGVTTTHFFKNSDFRVPGSATVFEIVASINGDSNIAFSASTSEGATKVVIYPRDKNVNDITVLNRTSFDANSLLGFPTTIQYSLLLYRNDKLLFEDGADATVTTRLKSTWDSSIVTGDTLIYTVDKTPSLTITFTDALFQTIATTATVNMFTDINIWAEAMNRLMTGVVATVNGEQIELSSARGESNRAAVQIIGGTLKNKIFTPDVSVTATGRQSDYVLNKNTGQIGLNSALTTGEKISAGSPFTRANLQTTQLPSGPTSNGKLWTIVDGGVTLVPTGLSTNTLTSISKSGTKITITSTTPTSAPFGYDQVQPRDWLLLWAEDSDSVDFPTLFNFQGFWRVESVERGKIVVDDGVTTRTVGATESLPTDRVVVVRSLAPMQELNFLTDTLSGFANQITAQLVGVEADIVGSTIRISTLTAGPNGELIIVAANTGGKSLGMPISTVSDSIPSHRAFIVTQDSEAGMPSFTWSTLGAASTVGTIYNEPSYLDIGGSKNDFVEVLDRYNNPFPELITIPDSNKTRRVFVKNFDPTTNLLTVNPKAFMGVGATPLKQNDRYFLRTSYQFDASDTTTIVVDADPVTKAFSLSPSRAIAVSSNSSPTLIDFSATDGESSLALNDPASFSGFDFRDFKVWRKATTILTNGTYDIRMQNADYGPGGNKIRVGFIYPKTLADTAIAVNFGTSDVIDAAITIPVATPRTPDWDGTSSFTTDVVTTGGMDTITYTWRIGTQPNFLSGGANVLTGDVCMVDSASNFLAANKDIQAKVSNVTSTTFTLQLPSGKVVGDNITFSVMSVFNSIATVVTNGIHNIQPGDRIGVWGTAPTTGSTAPLDGVYFPTVTGPSSFAFQVNPSSPGEPIQSATHAADVITINAVAHGLFVGNVIVISGVGSGLYNGTAVVRTVPSLNQFTVIRKGSSSPIVGQGRFDYQSYVPDYSVNVTNADKSADTVTVITASNHGFTPGDVVTLSGFTMAAWSSVTSYSLDDIINYSGSNYQSKSNGNTNHQPDISPTFWTPTTENLEGTFTIDNTPTLTTFTYTHDLTLGGAHATGGLATRLKQFGRLARSLGSSGDVLSFASVSTTAQAVVDFITQNLPNMLVAAIEPPSTGTELITSSTADANRGASYTLANLDSIRTVRGSRLITATVDQNIPAGSTINVTSLLSQYNGQYVVLSTVQTSISVWTITLQTNIVAQNTITNGSLTGLAKGSIPYLMMKDGENSVLSTNLGALIGSPMFTMKNTWNLAPKIGESLKLLACNTDQLNRFWDRLVVTGLSNVTALDNSEYGRQLQISSNTFGASGSVQVTGGSANTAQVALIGSGSELNSRIGTMTVPFDLRKGFNEKFWVNVAQSVRNNKITGLASSSVVSALSDGIQIISGPGTFQTLRSTSQTSTAEFKVERHGKFVAYICIGGGSLAMFGAGVKEGDWVHTQNIAAPSLYDSVTNYTPGNRVTFSGLNWTCMANNGPTYGYTVQPIPTDAWNIDTLYALHDTVTFNNKAYLNTVSSNIGNYPNDAGSNWQLIWEVQEWSGGNTGIFRVVRVFGDNTFWIENPNSVEEMIVLGDAGNIAFYSFDSVMPGDTLVVSGPVLGSSNIGRFTVAANPFPTATRLHVDTIMIADSNVTLGDAFVQVNIEEAAPMSLWKRIFSIGPGANNLATIIVDSPELMNRITSSNGAFIVAQGKLGYATAPAFGLDAYKAYDGLIKELNKVIYGDPSDPVNFPGVRAAGTDVDIKEAIVRRILISVSIRVRTGIPFSEVKDSVKAAIAGYVNNLGTGVQVSLSKVIEAASKVNGVSSVVITFPTFDITNDQIAIAANEKALIADPTNDITVSVLAG